MTSSLPTAVITQQLQVACTYLYNCARYTVFVFSGIKVYIPTSNELSYEYTQCTEFIVDKHTTITINKFTRCVADSSVNHTPSPSTPTKQFQIASGVCQCQDTETAQAQSLWKHLHKVQKYVSYKSFQASQAGSGAEITDKQNSLK